MPLIVFVFIVNSNLQFDTNAQMTMRDHDNYPADNLREASNFN